MGAFSVAGGQGQELRTRVVSALVLGAVALVALWQGGWLFSALVAAAVGILFLEWCVMQKVGQSWRLAGLAVLACVIVLAQLVRPGLAFVVLGGGILILMLAMMAKGGMAGRKHRWLGSGLLYAGLPALAFIWLRQQPDGFQLLLWTMAIVWATDILAYFTGRRMGGAKLAPAISPNKTWSGLLGGMAGAAAASAALAASFWGAPFLLFLLAGALLAIVAQSGDLFESWLKRRAGVKDSGHLIPGHGGMMDRVDGLVPVAVVVGLFVFLTRLPEGFWKNCEGCSA